MSQVFQEASYKSPRNSSCVKSHIDRIVFKRCHIGTGDLETSPNIQNMSEINNQDGKLMKSANLGSLLFLGYQLYITKGEYDPRKSLPNCKSRNSRIQHLTEYKRLTAENQCLNL